MFEQWRRDTAWGKLFQAYEGSASFRETLL